MQIKFSAATTSSFMWGGLFVLALHACTDALAPVPIAGALPLDECAPLPGAERLLHELEGYSLPVELPYSCVRVADETQCWELTRCKVEQ